LIRPLSEETRLGGFFLAREKIPAKKSPQGAG
jgi:hypothetical protein